MKDNNDFKIFIAISAAAHLLVAIVLIFGLPSWKKLPDEQIITFEILPVSDKANIKTQKVQKEKAVEAEEAKEVKRSTQESEVSPQEPEKLKAEAEVAKPNVVAEKTPEKTPELIKSDTPTPEKIPEKKPEPAKEEKPKAQEEKKAAPKEIKKKNKDADLDSLLKTLEKASEGKQAKSRKEARSEQSDAEYDSKGVFDSESPISISEYQAIKQQIERNWNVPVGAKNSGDIKITLYIALKPDGEVMQVKLISQQCPAGDNVVCQAAADSAIRAVYQASPFQNLSSTRYNAWKEFEIVCDPSNI